MIKLTIAIACAAGTTAPLLAQEGRPATIVIAAVGSAETPPDTATLAVTITGAGRTPDVATAALVAKQKAVFDGIRSLDPRAQIKTGSIAIREIHGGNCSSRSSDEDTIDDAADSGSPISQADKGPCRVTGHIAKVEADIEMSSVKDAGTAVGLAGRLGARNAKVDSFGLRNDSDAQRRAIEKAMTQARTQAGAIAAASGARLGPVVSVTNVNNGDGIGDKLNDLPQLRSLLRSPLPPISLDIAPPPVQSFARLTVTFALER